MTIAIFVLLDLLICFGIVFLLMTSKSGGKGWG